MPLTFNVSIPMTDADLVVADVALWIAPRRMQVTR